MNLCTAYKSYDISPQTNEIIKQDCLNKFPRNYQVCVTNPPWLAKNSATNRKLAYPVNNHYDDVYKFALAKCLANCDYVAALIPESFIRCKVLKERMFAFISITRKLFVDTDQPVALALFVKDKVKHTKVYSSNKYLGTLNKLLAMKPLADKSKPQVSFNDINGNIGLIAFDNTTKASIRFCSVAEIKDYQIKESSRFITRIKYDGYVRIKVWNDFLTEFRHETHDVLLTCFKGLRKDGMYRRRLDWKLARGIIQNIN